MRRLRSARDGTLAAVQLNADPESLQVREGLRGLKPLSDKDRGDIRKTIQEKILGGRPIAFRSTAVEPENGGLTVHGELELAGTTRPASFELSAAAEGRVRGTLPVTQSEWGIKLDPGDDGRAQGAGYRRGRARRAPTVSLSL